MRQDTRSLPSSEEEYDQFEEEDKGLVLAQSRADAERLTEEDYRKDEPKKQVIKETADKQGNPNRLDNILPVLALTSCLSKWRLAHSRGYHVRRLIQDPAYKELFMEHELSVKSSVPLPLVCLNEEETLQILMNTEEDYCKMLGAQHTLTQEVRERIGLLRVRVAGKSPTPLKENPKEGGAWASLHSWTSRLLRGGAVKPQEQD